MKMICVIFCLKNTFTAVNIMQQIVTSYTWSERMISIALFFAVLYGINIGRNKSRLAVKDYIIHNECAVQTDGMPCLFNKNKKADTLEVVLYDEIIDLEVHLYYTVFDEYNIIARHTVIINKSDSDIKLLSAYSASVDLPMDNYEMIHFAGSWGRERAMHRTKLEMGMKAEVENARGGSGHQLNPFSMITSVGTDETHGEVYGFSLVYSGNHSTVAKIDQFGNLRVQQGINPHQFEWILKPNESFCTPQSIICYSDSGIGAMTREYHDVFRNNLMRSKWVNKKRPILINNWEGTYFDFTEEKLLQMAEKAHKAGIELFVLDDGWFGKRDDDLAGLGDWTVNEKKLGMPLSQVAEKIRALGMKFGIWIEPEMVCEDSDLYREHPDWAFTIPGRKPVRARYQLVLDYSRKEVVDGIFTQIAKVLDETKADYVKMDMNRHLTDVWSKTAGDLMRECCIIHRRSGAVTIRMQSSVSKYSMEHHLPIRPVRSVPMCRRCRTTRPEGRQSLRRGQQLPWRAVLVMSWT